jgi:hypothetical protein
MSKMQALNVIRTFCYAIENQMKFVTKDMTNADLRWRSDKHSPPAPAAGWMVGHVLTFQEQVVNQIIFKGPELLPTDYYSTFSFNSDGEFPESFDISDVFIQFKNVTGKIVEELMSKNNDWLEEFPDDSVFPPNWQNKNHMKVFVLHFNHCFTHSGQILEIKRLRNKGAWGF